MFMTSFLNIVFILLYMLFFLFSDEYGKTGPFLVLLLVILLMLYTLRIYPLQINFNEKKFNLLKALGGCFFGYALTWFSYRVSKLERLRKFLLAMAGILACSEGAFLPLYNETGSPMMLWVVYGIMCCDCVGNSLYNPLMQVQEFQAYESEIRVDCFRNFVPQGRRVYAG